jgi:hypothetical protein
MRLQLARQLAFILGVSMHSLAFAAHRKQSILENDRGE